MGRGQELLDAARNGERRTVEKILGQITKRSGPFTSLRRGAGVNVQDDNGYTPLHHACLNGHKEIVRMLLSVSASPCIADKRGATPLHLAAWKGESNIVAMLLAHKTPPVNVDQLTQDHETALLSAAHFGYTDVVAQLIAKGADVTIRNIRDESALDLAAQYGRLETVQHLLRVMPQLVDPYKPPKCRAKLFASTPLHRASKNGRKEVVQVLLAAGIDPNIRTHNGTPLHEAACFRKASVVRILLANGADLNATDRRGMTVHDLLADYSEEATRKVRRVIREFENHSRITYESEEELPPFPVQDYSPTGYPLPNIVSNEVVDGADFSLCPNTDASITNINCGEYKICDEVSNAEPVKKCGTLSPSLKQDIIEQIQIMQDRCSMESNPEYANVEVACDSDDPNYRLYDNVESLSIGDEERHEDFTNCDQYELYQNLDVPTITISGSSSSLQGKPKPPVPPKPNKSKIGDNSLNENENESLNNFTDIQSNSLSQKVISEIKIKLNQKENSSRSSDTPNKGDKIGYLVRKLSDTVSITTTINLPDDEKVKKINPLGDDTYITMDKSVNTQTNKKCRKKVYSEVCDYELGNKYGLADKYSDIVESLYIDNMYVSMDRRKQFQKLRSRPNLTFKSVSVHNKGDNCCIYESLDYLYHYELNPNVLSENVQPFVKIKERANSIPCICLGHDGVSPKIDPKQKKKNEVDSSQLVYYSCEDVYVQISNNNCCDTNDAQEVEQTEQPNVETNNLASAIQAGAIFNPFDETPPKIERESRRSSVLKRMPVLKKKIDQVKSLFTEWKAPETQEKTNKIKSFVSPSSSQLTKHQSQSFVKKLASKCLGLKAKFNSAPNISNNSSQEAEGSVKSKHSESKNSTNTLLIGNSKFFKKLSKKEESGEIVCTDEFDTISLDRLSTLNRDSTVNRSNRSCPGFKTSLPNITENNEHSDSEESIAESVVMTEIDCDKSKEDKINEAINYNASNIVPMTTSIEKKRISVTSNDSANLVNECYEGYEFADKNALNHELIPRPPPRPNMTVRSTNSDSTIYENITVCSQIARPTPAARTHIPAKHQTDETAQKVLYENVSLLKEKNTPEPPKRTLYPSLHGSESTSTRSRSSTLSSDSLIDETNLEDILLSQKSKSFKHGKHTEEFMKITKSNISRTSSNSSDSSNFTEASAIENVDCSSDSNEKSIYLSMTGTLPNKKIPASENKKVLFRHKTFTNIEVDRNSVKLKSLPFFKETLAHYHIRGTGHCIYSGPTLSEFIYVFNRDTLYKDVPPFTKVPNDKRDSYFETAICFCRPKPPKHHNSAEDLLDAQPKDEKESVSIDIDALKRNREMKSTSFRCFCDSNECTFHSEKRDTGNLVVKFSAIKKSISTPDITLNYSPSSTIRNSGLIKNKSVPSNLEEPYAVVTVEDIVARQKIPQSNCTDLDSPEYVSMLPSTLSSNSSNRPYSLKDISDVISLTSRSTVTSQISASDSNQSLKKSSSEHSGHWSLQSCNSNVTIKSDASFVTCFEESEDESEQTLHSDEEVSDTETVKSEVSTAKRPWVHSDSFRFGNATFDQDDVITEEKDSSDSKFESGISVDDSDSSSSEGGDDSGVPRVDDVSLASLERGCGVGAGVRSGSGRRRWDEAEGASEGDALSVSSAASSCAPLHLAHHHEYSKVSPTPPKKPPRRNLSVSPTHANSPSSGYSYELRPHARSQDDLDDIQGAKHYLKHGRSVDQYVDGKLSYSEYEDNHNSPRIAPVPNPRPSLKNRSQPVAITAMYENVVIKEQNPRRKLRRNNFGPQYENHEPRMNDNRVRKYSNQERSSLESLLDDQSMKSPSDCERYYDGPRVEIPLSPSHYEQPPTPEHPPPSAKQAENSIHERIRPLSQEYKRRSALRDSYTETEVSLLRAASAASVASGATDRSGNTDNCVEEYVCDVPFAGLFKGSTTTLDGIGLRPMPAERPKTLRKLKSVYDASPTDPPPLTTANLSSNGQAERPVNGLEEEVRRRSNTTSSTQSGDKSLSILSPFDEQEEWAKISEIMASFGSKLVRESVFVSELEQEFTSRLGLSCSESSLSPSVASTLGLWLAGLGLHDYEPLFLESGYDDIDFINGILDENDLREIGIEETDRQKILESAKQLPLKITEISNNHNNNNISKNQNESVDEWLRNINLEIYSDTFRKHLYVDMDRVKRIWEVELTAVLEIHKPGHRKRILASVSGEHNGPATNNMEDINADLNTLKNNIQQLKEEIKEKLPVSENLKPVPPPVVPTLAPPGGETLKRSKKNRPAPQPPRPSDLEIRAPSELLVGVPGALKTQWKHQPFVLVTGAVTYVANYLGSTVVKELRGTESTKKSIQKLKKSTKEPRDSPDIILSISYRGVKFLNTITRELICEHEIRNIHCACQDADDLTHFAYITKDHATRSHYCHVFRVATMDQATEVILTLGEAFEVAYQMALREQSNRVRVTQSMAKTPTHDPMTTSNKEKPNVNHGRSHSITEIKLNGHQLKIAPIPASLSNEDFQAAARNSDGSRSPRTPLLKAPIASTEEL